MSLIRIGEQIFNLDHLETVTRNQDTLLLHFISGEHRSIRGAAAEEFWQLLAGKVEGMIDIQPETPAATFPPSAL